MAQAFLTYEQQIDMLVNDKNLIIADKKYAIDTLKQIGYFALIGGYKDLFKNPTTQKYNAKSFCSQNTKNFTQREYL